MKMSDEPRKLVKRIAENSDIKAFQQFYDCLFDKLFAFALQFTRSREMAEEVVSDVFLKIWKNRSGLVDIDNIETYLHVAVKNQSYTYIKKQLKHRHERLVLEQENLYFAVENFHPEKVFLSEETRRQLDEAIESLPSACKAAFLLVKENGLSYKDTAAILEVSPHTVKNHIIAALKKLREYLMLKAEQENRKVARQRWIQVAKVTLLILMVRFF